MSIGAYRDYHLLEIGTKIYLVFSSKRIDNNQNIVLMCKVVNILIQEKNIYYTCEFIKFVTGKYDISKQLKRFTFADYSINPKTNTAGLFTNIYIVFDNKEKCKEWLGI